jgi:hypothetical protein
MLKVREQKLSASFDLNGHEEQCHGRQSVILSDQELEDEQKE